MSPRHPAHSHTPACPSRALLAGAALSPGAAGQLRYDSRLLVVEPFPWRGCTLVTSHLLPGTQFNCKRTSTGVHLEGSGLAAGCRPAAILAVNEELPDLLSHRNVVNHYGQFGIVHRALLCQVGKEKRESARTETPQEHFQEPLRGNFILLPSLAKAANSQMGGNGTSHEYSHKVCKPLPLVCPGAW